MSKAILPLSATAIVLSLLAILCHRSMETLQVFADANRNVELRLRLEYGVVLLCLASILLSTIGAAMGGATYPARPRLTYLAVASFIFVSSVAAVIFFVELMDDLNWGRGPWH